MEPCINQVTTLGTPFEADLPAYSRAGWRSVELWLTKLETFLGSHTTAEARDLLAANGLTAPAASGQGGLLLARGPERAVRLEDFRRRLDLLAELGVGTLVVAADAAARPGPDDYARAAEALAEVAALADARGVRIALEPQAHGGFVASLDTALALVAQAGAANLGVCLDLFHYYVGPSKFEDLAYLAPANLAWVQLCDLAGVPRELARDADRVLPGDGDFVLGPILDHLRRIGYDGGASLELLNPLLWEIPADRVADLAHRATLRALGPSDGPGAATGGP